MVEMKFVNISVTPRRPSSNVSFLTTEIQTERVSFPYELIGGCSQSSHSDVFPNCGVISAQGQCPPGWRENDNKCYFFSTDAKSWMEANAYCLQNNSNLMSVQDMNERVRRYISQHQDDETGPFMCLLSLFQRWVSTQIMSDIYWIGLNDRITETVWEWSDGSPFIQSLSYVHLSRER